MNATKQCAAETFDITGLTRDQFLAISHALGSAYGNIAFDLYSKIWPQLASSHSDYLEEVRKRFPIERDGKQVELT
jgi:hypothetical protein